MNVKISVNVNVSVNVCMGVSVNVNVNESANANVNASVNANVKVNCEGRAIQVETPRGNAYFTVGARIDMDNIEASIQHGLLTLRVPKREAKRVEVKVLEQES